MKPDIRRGRSTLVIFFFQAEDGIRDLTVTGVQTCALPILAIAGGLRDSAKHSQVLLFHRVPGGWAQVKRLNMKKMLKEGNLDEDAYLQPGDFLYIPKNTMSKIGKFIPTSSLGLYANPALMR